MRDSIPAAHIPVSRTLATVAACFALSGCAGQSAAYRASLASFGAPSLTDIFAPPQTPPPATRSAAPAPKPRPASECGAVTPERCLLGKGIIGPHGGGHD